MDILDRVAAYDCSDGGHSDAAEGTAFELLSDATDEIKMLRSLLEMASSGYISGSRPDLEWNKRRDEALHR